MDYKLNYKDKLKLLEIGNELVEIGKSLDAESDVEPHPVYVGSTGRHAKVSTDISVVTKIEGSLIIYKYIESCCKSMIGETFSRSLDVFNKEFTWLSDPTIEEGSRWKRDCPYVIITVRKVRGNKVYFKEPEGYHIREELLTNYTKILEEETPEVKVEIEFGKDQFEDNNTGEIFTVKEERGDNYILEKVEEVTYSVGDKFEIDSEIYILARTGTDIICLVSLVDGNRYTKPINVKDSSEITQEEFDEIPGADNFKPVEIEDIKVKEKD